MASDRASFAALCGETLPDKPKLSFIRGLVRRNAIGARAASQDIRVDRDLGVTCQLVTDTFVLHGNPKHLVPSASRATHSGGSN